MDLSGYKRIVIKVGSALLVDQSNGQVKGDWMQSLCDDIAGLAARGADILIVSSGAIAMGRRLLKLPGGTLDLDQSQASASVGQIALARAWTEYLGAKNLQAAQILLTTQNTEDRRHYLNARATISTLLSLKCVPVINENDTVATAEIRYGDNDRLAARVASMVEADLLILLSDIDGLYTANPAVDPQAVHISVIDKITPEIEAMAGGAASEFSRGGMKTKVEAAKIATGAGCAMVIARGNTDNPVRAILDGGTCTIFKAAITPVAARKKWIAGTVTPRGRLLIDAGAIAALVAGKSLLPAGVRSVDGDFMKGDIISICSEAGMELARGLVAYDTGQAQMIAGRQSVDIASLIGTPFRTEMVHRDDMVMLKDAS